MNTSCKNCGQTIHVMCFLGQDYCSENCRKDLKERRDGLPKGYTRGGEIYSMNSPLGEAIRKGLENANPGS